MQERIFPLIIDRREAGGGGHFILSFFVIKIADAVAGCGRLTTSYKKVQHPEF